MAERRSHRAAPVWKFFEKSSDWNKIAICNYCNRGLSYKTTITNLKNHLKQKHRSVYREFLNISQDREVTATEPTNVSHLISLSANEPLKLEDFDDDDESTIYIDTGEEEIQISNQSDSDEPLQKQTKKDKKPVPIWNFFEKSKDGHKIAVCNYCNKDLSYKTTISNLKNHLQNKHNSAYTIFLNMNQKNLESTATKPTNVYSSSVSEDFHEENTDVGDVKMICSDANETRGHLSNQIAFNEPPKKLQTVIQPRQLKLKDNNRISLSLLKMIVYDFHPFSIVNDIGFRMYSQALNSSYEIPDSETLSANLLPIVYEKREKEIKSFVNTNAMSVCITVDCWTSRAMENLMGITAHFLTKDPLKQKSLLIQCCEFKNHDTGINIHRKIKQILQNWEIYDKVNFFVTNNASNMVNAAQYVEDDGWIHFVCFALKFNLVVQDALVEIEGTINKVNRIVNYFTKNTIVKETLLNYQINQEDVNQPKYVITSVPTKWQSVYLMLERFVYLGESIRAIIPDLEADLPIISAEEWRCLEHICIVLKPFYDAATEMSAENYLVASKAIVLSANLINICNNYSMLEELHPSVKALAIKLRDGMTCQFEGIEHNNAIALSTILDPRFKLRAIKNNDSKEKIRALIKRKIVEEIDSEHQHDPLEPAPSTSDATNKIHANIQDLDLLSYGLWREFDIEANNEIVSKTSEVMASEELEKYLADTLIKRTECPLKYWDEHKCIYPNLFKLFMKYFNIVVTSVACEHLFTKYGDIISDRRTRLSATKVAQIMFLNVNKIE